MIMLYVLVIVGLTLLLIQGVRLMTAIEKLQANAAALSSSIDSAITTVQGIIASIPNNDAAINAVADDLAAQKAKLDAAVASLK